MYLVTDSFRLISWLLASCATRAAAIEDEEKSKARRRVKRPISMAAQLGETSRRTMVSGEVENQDGRRGCDEGQ